MNTGRFEIDRIPSFVTAAAKKNGADVSSVRLAAKTDRNLSNEAADRYLFISDDFLIIVEGREALKPTGAKGYTRPKNEVVFECASVTQIPLVDISDLTFEALISSGRITAKVCGEPMLLAVYTNFCKTSAELLCKYFDLVKKGEFCGADRDDEALSERCPICHERFPKASGKVCPKCAKAGSMFLRMGRFFLRYKGYLIGMIITLVIMTATSVLAPYLSSGFYFDEVLNKNGGFYGQLLFVLSMVVGVRVITQLASMLNNYVTSIIAAKVTFDLKRKIFSSIQRLSVGFFTSRQTGGLMAQVNSDANTIYYFFCDTVPYFFVNIAQVAVIAVLMFALNPILSVCSLITLPLFVAVVRYIYYGERKYHIRRFSAMRSLSSMLSEMLTGAKVVKAFAKEKEENIRFSSYNSRMAKAERDSSEFRNDTSPISSLILYAGNIITWGLGGVMCMRGEMTYGQLLTFIAYINMIFNPMHFFVTMSNSASSCAAAMQRLFAIDDAEPEIKEASNAIPLEDVRGSLEFCDINFSYDRSRKILQNISFKAEAGTKLGIVGRTGAGKTTLVNLILRLYDAESGCILLDGHNLQDITLKSIYDNIAVVSQETYLFIGTILDNIRYACPDATYDEVVSAAKAAGAHDFIMKLPDAYMTRVGFGYSDLSGGERQRLSIARAILKNPRILILDEATAAMDTRTERMIQDALSDLSKGRTTITIAHRLSTLRDSDELIVIDGGVIAERGTHAELISKEDGIYHKLYNLQTEALKSAGVAE